MFYKLIFKLLSLIYYIFKKIFFLFKYVILYIWNSRFKSKMPDLHIIYLKKKSLLEKIYRYFRFLLRSRRAQLRCILKLKLFLIGFSKMCIFNKSNFILWMKVIKFLCQW